MGKFKLPHLLLVLSLLLCIPAFVNAQSELVIPSSDGTTFLNEQILADASRPADRVYVLQRNGNYYMNDDLRNDGFVLRIRGEAGTGLKPVIYLVMGSAGFPPAAFVMAADLYLKDVVLVGFYEGVPAEIANIPPRLIDTAVPGVALYIDGCIVTNERGEHIRVAQTAAARVVKITNSIFSNMGDLGRSNLGAGRALDLRNTSLDSLILVNNTFVNFHDRIVRHYQSVAAIKYFKFDHNTIVNGLSYHSTMSLGWTGDEAIITNNLFIDHHIAGADTDAVRQAEFGEPGELDPRNGLGKIVWILSVPNETTQWTVAGNYYSVSPAVQAFYDQYSAAGVLGEGPALNHHVNVKLGADSANAFKKEGITLANTPKPMLAMAQWYRDPAGGNKTKSTTNFVRALHDYDRRPWQYFADTLDCAYLTTTAAYTGAQDGFPTGDLNWFPDKKAQWEQGPVVTIITVDGNKDPFYETLTGPDDGYLQLKYYSANDNGTGPYNNADLSAKMWVAWDETWFYFYEEVMDDTISMSSANSYQNDGLEIKIDPQPTDSVANSITSLDMTALYTDGSAGQANIGSIADVGSKQLARKVIPGGYALELAVKWSAITAGNPVETITPAVGNVFGAALHNHDNDNKTGTREASVAWAAVLLDAVWNTPKYLGTVKFLADNKLQFIPKNNMTPRTNPVPYDGTPFFLTIDGKKDPIYKALHGPKDGYLQVKSYAFNEQGIPVSDADLSASVWTMWDDTWFYLYEEVKDDTLAANATDVWNEDEIELKIDPQPTDSTQQGPETWSASASIWEGRLTALGMGTAGVVAADSLNNVANADKKWARTKVTGGYNLEMAIKWSAIMSSNGETITPGADNIFGMAINQHDNDGKARRQASIQWAAVMNDNVWNRPKYHGTVKFLADNKLQFIPKNNMTGVTNPIPYDGTTFYMRIDGKKDPFYYSLKKPSDGYLQIRPYAHTDAGRPVNDADLSAKVWTAWDDQWFYLYEEVMDDTLAGNATDVWNEDCIELKIDPQPTDSTQQGPETWSSSPSIWDTRFTALSKGEAGVVAADSLSNVPDSLKKWTRTKITGGYSLEMAVKWSVIKSSNSETITPANNNVFGMAILQHDNDNQARRQASIAWGAVLLDNVWNMPKYHGTVKFLASNKLQFTAKNNMTGVTNPIPYDGSDYVGVAYKEAPLVPTVFSLEQNYPNPFNPTTTISYSIPSTSQVHLAIYDMLGRELMVLVNEKKEAGNYIVTFDGKSYASGLYFCRLRAGSDVKTQKMMLLK